MSSDLTRHLSLLKRPRLLVGAARKGLSHYRRDRDLNRLVGNGPGAQTRLLAKEEALEETRSLGQAGYSAALHITVLTALLAEAQLI